MKRAALLAVLLLSLSPAARAHRPDVYMTEVALKADGDSLRVRVEATALAWMVEVAGEEGSAWPAEKLRATEDYLRDHLIFSVDGRPLEGRLLRARYVRDPWMSDFSAVFVFDLLYPLPSTGSVFAARSRVFVENWEENEGAASAGLAAAPSAARDFRTRFRWSFRPGRVRTAALGAPGPSIPLEDLRRPAWEAYFESASLGFSVVLGAGGFLAFLLSAALFPPAGAARWAGLAAAGVSALIGALLPVPLGERALWAGVAVLGLTSVTARPAPEWTAGLVLGAAAAARFGVLAGDALRQATAFARFSPAAYGAGFLVPLAAVPPLRRLAAAFHRRSLRYLMPQEYGRQALFHRGLISRLLALAGLFWLLSPFWTAPR